MPMGVHDTEVRDDDAAPHRPGLALASDRHATGDTLTAAVEGRCVNCDAPLAPDQRYCVQCGQRRGRSRFAVARAAEMRQTPASPRGNPPGRRGSSGTTVVAGIATLVLAMGVGVEIGRSTNQSPAPAPRAQVITVDSGGGGGAGTATSATTTTAASASAPSGRSHARGASHSKRSGHTGQVAAAPAPKPTAKAVQKASSAASGVLGAGSGQSNATVTTGQSCSAGSAGCQGGHFTGNYFGN